MQHIDLDKIKIDEEWKEALSQEFLSPYFAQIKSRLLEAKKKEVVYPPSELIFNAFNLTPLNQTKVVILGQDPYHGKDQAMGLSFSVKKGIKIPPSLVNVFKEIHSDLGLNMPSCGDLTPWAKQGVLLLNTSLSVSANKPNSHAKFGWQTFTDAAIKALSEKKENIVFLLWGNPAKAKAHLIDEAKHLILRAAHPSPLARGGFFDCKHFSQANAYLHACAKTPINWDLSETC